MQNPIGRWIAPLYRYRKSFMAKRLEPYGAASRLFMMLLEISRNDGMNQEQISGCLKIDKATTAKALSRLESEGYIRRETDPDDRRINRVFVTEKSPPAVAAIENALAEWDRLIRADVSAQEYQAAEAVLHKMAASACKCPDIWNENNFAAGTSSRSSAEK